MLLPWFVIRMRLLPTSWIRQPRGLVREVSVIGAWCAAIAFLELLGRNSEDDLRDGLCVLLFTALLSFTIIWHRRQPLKWFGSLLARADRARSWLRMLAIELGIDFRGEPALPVRIPSPIALAFGIVLCLLLPVSVGVLCGGSPDGARQWLTSRFYTAYLILLSLVWAALIAGTLLTVFAPIAMLHDFFMQRRFQTNTRQSQRENAALLLFFGTMLIGGATLPRWLPMPIFVMFAGLSVIALLFPIHPDLRLLWRSKDHGGKVYSTSFCGFIAAQVALFLLFVVLLHLCSQGNPLDPETFGQQKHLPITSTLGFVFSWSALGSSIAIFLQIMRVIRLAHRFNPQRAPLKSLFVTDRPEESLLAGAVKTAARIGWSLRCAPKEKDACAVPIRLREKPLERDPFAEIRWPLEVSVEEIATIKVAQRLERRFVLQVRRQIARGLEKLLRFAAQRKFTRGNGFWIGLQHWFILGLSRDVGEESADFRHHGVLQDIIGPPYFALFSQPARHHFLRVMNSLELDLIFVEDGVRHRKLQRVIQQIFEIYDIFGENQRAEERHFVGLPGLRVLIHEFELNRPFRSSPYPEPDYDDVGRARILHVFKDRGEHEEKLELPFHFRGVPLPALR